MLKTEFSKLLQPHQPLNENPLAKSLYSMLERDNFSIIGDPENESDVLDWISRLLTLSIEEVSTPAALRPKEQVEEYLFKNISIKGVKKIPRGDCYRRLDFCNDKDKVVSTIIMGENGVGKSSFYGSMEFVGMGEMKTAQIYNQQNSEYIRNLFSVNSDVSVILKTTKIKLILDLASPTVNCLPVFYISEWDIRELEKQPDFGPFIFSQLGVQNVNLLLSLLIAAKNRLEISISSNEAIKESIRQLRQEIEALKLIIEKKPTLSDDDIRNLFDETIVDFPSLMENNRLVENHKTLIDSFERTIQNNIDFPIYEKYFQDLSATSILETLKELKNAIRQHQATPCWLTKKYINNAIARCRKALDDFTDFHGQFIHNVNSLLDTHLESIHELIDFSFDRMAELSEKKGERIQTIEYSIIDNSENPEKTLEYLKEIIDILQSRFNDLIKKYLNETIKPTLKALLFEYLKDDNEDIEILYNESERSISALLVVPTQNESGEISKGKINPRAYFNTFRFKMFVVSLKIALACCAKLIYNTNWPIVIDDVFNSSDFNNRSRMDEYVKKICETYDGLEKVKDMQLQIILFTQDDVIGDAVFKGLTRRNKSAKLLRIHDYRCFNNSEIIKSDDDVTHVNIGIEIDSHYFG